MTDDELRERFDAVEERIKQLISDVAERIDQRFDIIDRRFEAVNTRLERLETNVNVVMMQTQTYNQSLADHDRQIASFLATQSAIQKTLEALAKQLREHKHGNGSSHPSGS
jgi:chromosome segregation ATPase